MGGEGSGQEGGGHIGGQKGTDLRERGLLEFERDTGMVNGLDFIGDFDLGRRFELDLLGDTGGVQYPLDLLTIWTRPLANGSVSSTSGKAGTEWQDESEEGGVDDEKYKLVGESGGDTVPSPLAEGCSRKGNSEIQATEFLSCPEGLSK